MNPEDNEPKLPVPANKGGRPRKNDSQRKVLPVLKLDFTKEPGEQVLPCPEKEQARYLNWRVSDVRSVNSSLGLATTIPMVCQASGCFWANQCPTAPDFLFKGLPCPLEIKDAFLYFLGYVRDLDIQPGDYVDLKLVEDLVRIDIQIRRIDQQLQVNGGMEVEVVGGVLQGEKGRAIYEKGAHPLLIVQDKLRKNRKEIHHQLIASRDAKHKVAREERQEERDILEIWSKMRKRIEKTPPMQLPDRNIIEGEIVDEDDENEE